MKKHFKYMIECDNERSLMFHDYYKWERLVRKRGWSTTRGWLPNGVAYVSMTDYCREVAK